MNPIKRRHSLHVAVTFPLLLAAGPSWLDSIKHFLRANLGARLKMVHEPIDIWLGQLPMWIAMVCAVGLYVVALIWVWSLRREFIFRGAPDQKWWRDLRIWGSLLVIPYIAIYLLLGR